MIFKEVENEALIVALMETNVDFAFDFLRTPVTLNACRIWASLLFGLLEAPRLPPAAASGVSASATAAPVLSSSFFYYYFLLSRSGGGRSVVDEVIWHLNFLGIILTKLLPECSDGFIPLLLSLLLASSCYHHGGLKGMKYSRVLFFVSLLALSACRQVTFWWMRVHQNTPRSRQRPTLTK